MNATSLNDRLGIITNIGVIIGLVLVAYQVSQTNQAMVLDHKTQSIETSAIGREGWQVFSTSIIDSKEVADIWLRGGQGKDITEDEAERFRWLAGDLFFLGDQQYKQATLVDGVPADWAVDQFAEFLETNPGLQTHIKSRFGNSSGVFIERLRERHPKLLE